MTCRTRTPNTCRRRVCWCREATLTDAELRARRVAVAQDARAGLSMVEIAERHRITPCLVGIILYYQLSPEELARVLWRRPNAPISPMAGAPASDPSSPGSEIWTDPRLSILAPPGASACGPERPGRPGVARQGPRPSRRTPAAWRRSPVLEARRPSGTTR